MEELYNGVLELLIRHNQAHLLQFYDELSEASQLKLLNQILSINWDQWAALGEVRAAQTPAIYEDLSPIGALDWELFSEEEQQYFTDKGWELLRQGKVGAIVVAGGQGSRLGHEGPRGPTILACLPTSRCFSFKRSACSICLSEQAAESLGIS